MLLVIKKESCKHFHTCLVVFLDFRFSFHSAQATTQEAKFCCKHTASKVPERLSRWCMGKGEKKRNKKLGALSRILQGQPLSTCRVLCPHLSHPGQLNLCLLLCYQILPTRPMVLLFPSWQRGVRTAAMPVSPDTAPYMFQTFLRILVQFRMASSWAKSMGKGGTRWEITWLGDFRSCLQKLSLNEHW